VLSRPAAPGFRRAASGPRRCRYERAARGRDCAAAAHQRADVAQAMIDLHTHSSASDGTATPAELVGVAAAAGITVLAITDHDTTAGWDEALAARPPGMTIVLGTEFSCRYVPDEGRRISLHLLGYLFDPGHEGLRAERARLRETRL